MRATIFRRAVLVIGTALCLVTAAVTADASAAAPAGPTDRQSFEQDMGGWQPDTDGRARDWRIYRTTEQAVDGTVGLGYYLNGHDDDGTIWIEHAFGTPPAATVTVTVSFWLHSTYRGDVNMWPVLGFAGPRDPEVERDLPIIGLTGRAAGWSQYTFTRKVSTDRTGTVWVAVGIGVTWETIRTHHIDLVETTITPG